jgi:arylsulfatase A-like enzyme
VIADQWKLIVYPKTGITRLFDLKSDPLEINDLSDDPAQASRIKTLQTELVGMQSQFGDSLRLQP